MQMCALAFAFAFACACARAGACAEAIKCMHDANELVI